MLAGSLLLVSLATTPVHAGMLEAVVDSDGVLDKQDQARDGGQWADIFPVDLQAGDRILIDMEGKKLDTFLVLKAPSGQVFENDDAGSNRTSQLDVIVEEGGTFIVYASSYGSEQKGKYHLRIAVARGDGTAPTGSTTQPQQGGEMAIVPISLGQPVQGQLGSGDATLDNGEWFDAYEVQLQAGQDLVLDMTSAELDTYVGVRAPSGDVSGNDDHEGSRSHSRHELVVEESGSWIVIATTYAAGEGGNYTLRVDAGQPQGTGQAQAQGSGGVDRWNGALEAGDTTLESGEYVDTYGVTGTAGDHWVIDLRSSAFDPYLVIRLPDGQQLANDDFEGASDRSLLDLTLEQSGDYAIGVTTYRPGESGAYDLSLRHGGESNQGGAQQHSGTLAAGDDQLGEGEWFDTYTFEGLPGQHLRVDLRGDFDTYLGVVGPGDFQLENDDGPEGSVHSQVEGVLTEAGTYTVVATSYSAGQGGSYTLDIGTDQAPASQADQRDVATIEPGQAATGSLDEDDITLETGEHSDGYVFDAVAGQGITVSLSSTAFDPYLALVLPDDSIVQNDDWEGSSELSRIELAAPISGRYRVVATSYRPGEVGEYAIGLELNDGSDFYPPTQAAGSGTTYGLFVGISDYPDPGPSDLDFTAEDAAIMYTGMQAVGMDPDNGVLLVDSDATADNFTTALRNLGSQMGADDRLVLFYSGHGGRLAREGFQAADPDGFDETLALYDAQITDDTLAELLEEIDDGTVLIVLDSCFSGGFSKDVISRPGRMGLFSSHEDVTSAVAHKFRAGGYLSRFMVEAIGERRADEDGDGALTALELSQYLYERYRSDVKSMPTDKTGAYEDIVLTGQNLGYQQIIVDRGGVGPSQVLFAW